MRSSVGADVAPRPHVSPAGDNQADDHAGLEAEHERGRDKSYEH
jgi:hypothetical protein